MSGSVEAACGLGLADAVVDLVETGTTMKVFDIKLALLYVYASIIIILLILHIGCRFGDCVRSTHHSGATDQLKDFQAQGHSGDHSEAHRRLSHRYQVSSLLISDLWLHSQVHR